MHRPPCSLVRFRFLLILFVGAMTGRVFPETVVLNASKDNTIYSESGSLSNGAGSFLFVGKTLGRQGTDLRRALVQFDLSGIPADAEIQSAVLQLTRNRGVTGSVSVHRLVTDWGEAGSDAGSPGGLGAAAQPGDATWTQNRFGESDWGTAGGDFVAGASDSTSSSTVYEWQGAGILADVEAWIDSPTTNHGWILIGDEASPGSAKRFVSPMLTIEFTRVGVPPEWQLSVNASPLDGGVVTGGGTFDDGVDAAITAVANDGFFFSGWLGNGVANPGAAETTVSMTADRTVTAQFVQIQRTLTVLADPVEGGTVSGGGTFDDGTLASITASAAEGFEFSGWLGEGVAEPGAAETTVSMTADRTVTAQFVQIQRTLTVLADPVEGGTVSGGGTFDDGTQASITASAAEGFEFSGWLGEGVAEPGAAETTVSMTVDRTVTAQFVRIQRTLTVLADPVEGGTVSGGGVFNDGTLASITASAAEGFEFSGWLGEGVAEPGAAETTVSMTADRTVTAQFVQIQRTLTVLADPVEGGTVSGGGTFDDGTLASITASAAEGFEFSGWLGEGVAEPGAAETTVSMTADRTVTAQFVPIQRTLTVLADPVEGGTVSGGGVFNDGTQASITASAAEGFEFFGWLGEGVAEPGAAETMVSMTADRTVTAQFVQIQRTLTVLADPVEGGAVSGGGTFDDGTLAVITASAAEGFEFSGWLGEGVAEPGIAETTVSMTTDRTVTAQFVRIQRTLTVLADPVEGGTVSGGGVFNDGTLASITAGAAEGFEFSGWLGEGVAEPGIAETTVSMTTDRTVTAQFVQIQRTLTVLADPVEGGTVSGGGTFDDGTLVSITASAAEGFEFSGWLGEGVADPGIAETTVQMTVDRTVTAQFVRIQRTLTVLADPVEGGTVSGGGVFNDGTLASITAIAAEGFEFSGWLGEGVADPGIAETTVSMTADRTVTAQFVQIQRTLTVLADPVEGGTVNGGGTFDDGTLAAITASATEGFEFSGWLGEGVAEPGAAETTVSMTADRTVTAQFVQIQRTLTVLADPVEGGTVSGGGTFDDGTEAPVAAVAGDGFRFDGWQGEGVADPDSANTTVSLDSDREVRASFVRVWALTLEALPEDGGTVSGDGLFDDGTSPVIGAVAADGFQFVRWEGDGVQMAEAPETEVAMTADRMLVAVFEPVSVDGDADGLADDWERENGLDPNDPTDAESDVDLDGRTALAEFHARTDPNDPLSLLEIREVARLDSEELRVVWSSVPDVIYTIEMTADLMPDSWMTVGSVEGSAGTETETMVSTVDGSVGLVRIVVFRALGE